MPFNSFQYACFLPAVVLLFHISPRVLRPLLLLVASYAFYASYNAVFLLLIIGLTALNYGAGLAIAAAGARRRLRATLLSVGVVLDVGVLAFFKYALFLLHSVGSLLGALHLSADLPEPSIFLPLGISFFTFEFIHYLIEVKRGSPPVRSPISFAVFAAFFPTQIAGPIKRYQSFIPQLDHPTRFDIGRFGVGLRMIFVGLFKKVVLADNLAPLVIRGFAAPAGLTVGDAWLVTLAFAMQIYLDFSGFTDIARGSARLIGYEVPPNFRRPYLSTNPSEFWRRWHMSLSTWFRDYLYIPLGGRRRRRFRNLWVTMVVAGLWHGANWTFVLWGAIHGSLLVGYWALHGVLAPRQPTGSPRPSRRWRPLTAGLGWVVTLTGVCVAWVFFRASTVDEAMTLLSSMGGWGAGGHTVLAPAERLFVGGLAVGLIAAELVMEWSHRLMAAAVAMPSRLARRVDGMSWHLQPVICAVLAAATLMFQPTAAPPFIYFHF